MDSGWFRLLSEHSPPVDLVLFFVYWKPAACCILLRMYMKLQEISMIEYRLVASFSLSVIHLSSVMHEVWRGPGTTNPCSNRVANGLSRLELQTVSLSNVLISIGTKLTESTHVRRYWCSKRRRFAEATWSCQGPFNLRRVVLECFKMLSTPCLQMCLLYWNCFKQQCLNIAWICFCYIGQDAKNPCQGSYTKWCEWECWFSFSPNSSGVEWGSQFFPETGFVPS